MSNPFDLGHQMECAESKCLSCGAPLPKGREEQRKFTGGMMSVLVLSDDTRESKSLYDNAIEAVKASGYDMQVNMTTEEEIISSYKVRKLPALVINGSIISQGIISSIDDIKMEIEYMY